MERLTARCDENVYFAKCIEGPCNGIGSSEKCDECEFDRSVRERLAEYEDTGLTPEAVINLNNITRTQSNSIIKMGLRIEELDTDRDYWKAEAIKATAELREVKIAEEQGLLIKLPCKVGDTVYANKKCLLNWYMFMELKPYVKCEVVNIKRTKTRTEINLRPLTDRTHNSRYHKFFGICSIGKTVFLTKEEAETALKGNKSNGC